MNQKDVKSLHFSDEEQKEYKQEKTAMKIGIIACFICIITFVISFIIRNENLSTYQFHSKQGIQFFSGVGIVVSILIIQFKKNAMRDIENKY